MADRFLITHWCGVPHKYVRHADGTLATERFEEMKAAGINLIGTYDYGYETNCEVLALCERLGLRVTLSDDRIGRAIGDGNHRAELLRAVVRDYAGYPALHGYHITDEPNSGAFPALAAVRQILADLDPVHEAYINLFPNCRMNDGMVDIAVIEPVRTVQLLPTVITAALDPAGKVLGRPQFKIIQTKEAKITCTPSLGMQFDGEIISSNSGVFGARALPQCLDLIVDEFSPLGK